MFVQSLTSFNQIIFVTYYIYSYLCSTFLKEDNKSITYYNIR